ncbi:hypothetical protein CPB86DRAFT_830744 [Serendipita vermifera]|nr:hypothetical protein CPB86DRAFT_830744 [Serendipita vermifera]
MNRRTMVLEPETPDEEWSDIKEQYLEERLHKESSILTKIHTKGIFPGVICLASRHPSLLTGTSVEYDATDGSGPIIRNKIRLWLKGKGDTFLSIKTPRDMLRIIFDVLEDYLLDKNAPGDDVSSRPGRPSRRRRLATKALVIDFDNGEDRDLTTANPSRHKKRTGTPIYMARRVRGMVVAEGQYTFPAILQVTEKMARHIAEEIGLEYDLHHLRYEAESLFWVLLFWCITAQPCYQPEWANIVYKRFLKLIPRSDWDSLIEVNDRRHSHFIMDFPRTCLHPAYSSFYMLLKGIMEQLGVDPEFTKDTLKKEPEYLHEAMQRLIINFLAENINNPFMDLERMDKWREQESPSMVAGTTTPQSSDSPRTEPHRPVKRQNIGVALPKAKSGGCHHLDSSPTVETFRFKCTDDIQVSDESGTSSKGDIGSLTSQVSFWESERGVPFGEEGANKVCEEVSDDPGCSRLEQANGSPTEKRRRGVKVGEEKKAKN